jgi:predicted GTPase
MTQIEKTNNLIFPKCFLLNKIDKLDKNQKDKSQLAGMIQELGKIRQKYGIKHYKVSALTGKGILAAFREYINRIYQQQSENEQNVGIEDDVMDDDDENRPNCTDKITSCSKKILCGRNIFICGVIIYILKT